MSKRKWAVDKHTGLPKSKMQWASEDSLTPDGEWDPSRFPDCNIFNKAEMQKLLGFKTERAFVHAIKYPGSLCHMHRTDIIEPETCWRIGFVSSTHTDSLFAFKEAYDLCVTRDRQERGFSSHYLTRVSSLSLL